MESSPLLGLCDGSIDKKKNTFYYTNKIGGSADLIPGVSVGHVQCTVCDGTLSHVVQIYCPLAASPYHRTIYVFACTNPQCCGKPESWKALRLQCLESNKIKQPPECPDSSSLRVNQAPMSTTDWCDDADDWGMESEEPKPESSALIHADTSQPETDIPAVGVDVSIRLQDLCLNGQGGSEASVPALTSPTFKPFYISVVEETDLEGLSDLEHANRLLKEYEEREGVAVREMGGCKGGEEGEEQYERAEAKHGDTVFSTFMRRIALCTEQVLRYSWSGSPLFIMEPPSNISQMVPPCRHCGSPRVFEFQLMPALVSMLQSTDSSSDLALEFGTVLVFTCKDSCWTSGSDVAVEEFLYVQTDPDQKLFK